jgi:predicted ATP-dependent serine protease
MPNIQSIDRVEVPEWMNEYISSGIKVLDELINGNGIVPSQVISLSASRGSGKTTLMLQYLTGIMEVNSHKRVLYISREEPSFQLKKTANRIGANGFDIIGDEEDCTIANVVDLMQKYDIVVLDSFSCMASDENESIKILKNAAKETHCSLICILHQTKAGVSKGSSSINHLVDSVIDIERGDPEVFGNGNTRILRLGKNRFGQTGDLILSIERDGWDFSNPIEAKSLNEENKTENRNSPQAKKPLEMSSIMNLVKEKGRISFSDLNSIIPRDDSAAVGRFARHLKELEKYGKLIAIGRGNDKVWEFVA